MQSARLGDGMKLMFLDLVVIITFLLLVLGVALVWKSPIPPALMRPAHTLRMGVDNFFHFRSQSEDGNRVVIESGDELFLSNVMIGDVIFITQPSAETQMFYVERFDHRRRFSLIHLIRDPK